MSDDSITFRNAEVDSNVWYHITEGRVDDYTEDQFTSQLRVSDPDAGSIVVNVPQKNYWQFQPVNDNKTQFALRCSATGISKQLSVCFNKDEIAPGKTQPCLRNSDGTDSQKWEIANWGNETYRFINVQNGSNYWMDVHPGNPLFMDPNIDTSVYQPAQRWLWTSVSDINDGAYSTTFTNDPSSTSSSDATTTTDDSTSTGGSSSDNSSSGDSSSGGLSTGAAAGIGVGVGLGVIFLGVMAFLFWRRRHRRNKTVGSEQTPAELSGPHQGKPVGGAGWNNGNQEQGYYKPEAGYAGANGYNSVPPQEMEASGFHHELPASTTQASQELDSTPSSHRHMSPASQHLSPASQHASPSNNYSSPANSHASHVNPYATPSDYQASPATQHTTPSTQHSVPR